MLQSRDRGRSQRNSTPLPVSSMLSATIPVLYTITGAHNCPPPFPRSSPQGTPEALPYPILRRMSSPSQSRAALRRAAGPLGRGVLGAPQALWARRCRRAGGAKRPFEFPIRVAYGVLRKACIVFFACKPLLLCRRKNRPITHETRCTIMIKGRETQNIYPYPSFSMQLWGYSSHPHVRYAHQCSDTHTDVHCAALHLREISHKFAHRSPRPRRIDHISCMSSKYTRISNKAAYTSLPPLSICFRIS